MQLEIMSNPQQGGLHLNDIMSTIQCSSSSAFTVREVPSYAASQKQQATTHVFEGVEE